MLETSAAEGLSFQIGIFGLSKNERRQRYLLQITPLHSLHRHLYGVHLRVHLRLAACTCGKLDEAPYRTGLESEDEMQRIREERPLDFDCGMRGQSSTSTTHVAVQLEVAEERLISRSSLKMSFGRSGGRVEGQGGGQPVC